MSISQPEGYEPERPAQSGSFFSIVVVILVMGCILVTFVGLSAGGGVLSGQQQRRQYVTQTVTTDLAEQYESAIQDIDRGAYGLAAQRVQYILSIDPDYPGAAEQLSVIAREQNLQGVPSSDPVVIEPTPLPPSAAEDPSELYDEALTFYNDGDWVPALARFEELHTLYPDYQSADVLDKLYDVRVRLGLQYVRGDRLQEGVLLLEQAAAIKPLDDQTAGELRIANLYLTGLTYWDINWNIVTQNLVLIYDIAPNYRDAASRLAIAYVRFADEQNALANYCEAADQYNNALSINTSDQTATQLLSDVPEKRDEAQRFCDDPSLLITPTVTPTEEGTPTP